MAQTSGAQDPALFEDSPAVQAAVLEERRFNNLEGKIDQVIVAVNLLKDQVAIANGRTSKNEASIEEARDEQAVVRNQLKDRRLWERLTDIETWRVAREKADAHKDGVTEGQVSLRMSDKFWFGTFITIGLAVLGAVLKFV